MTLSDILKAGFGLSAATIIAIVTAIFVSAPGPSCPNNAISHSVYWEQTRHCAKGCRWYTEYDRTVFCKNGTHYFDWLPGESHGGDDSYLVNHPEGISEEPRDVIIHKESKDS
jgi:hypothetical protein